LDRLRNSKALLFIAPDFFADHVIIMLEVH
jgi:hypothetical protein